MRTSPHERCGRHLYRSVAERTANPVLESKYEHFGEETERHVTILETLITAMGGDPNYVSPAARATEAADARIVESTFVLGGSVDVMTAEMTMLDAVLLAETVDHNNWQALEALIGQLPEGDVRQQLADSVATVLSQEHDHLGWARDTRLEMIRLQASSPRPKAPEDMTAAVRNWFTDE